MACIKNSKNHTDTSLCITGHRPKSLPWKYDENNSKCKIFKNDLEKIFVGAINYGISTFYVGMAEGFDMISAEILIKLRTKHNIKIIAVVPCLGQELKWNINQQKRYKKILKKCDEQIVLYSHYTPTCMNDRNKFMIDNSNFVIACYNGSPSGTRNTLLYAKKKGCKIRIINPDNYK